MRAVARHYWSLVVGARRWIGFAVALFVCGFVAGAVTGLVKPDVINGTLRHIASGGPAKGGPVGDFKIILTHNLAAALYEMCGSFIVALPTLDFVLHNGFMNGGYLVVGSKDYPFFWRFLSVVPHSIVEFPAFLLCSTFSLRLGLRWLFQKHGSDRKRVFLTDLANACKIGLLCIPLFFVAAAVESFVTPRIVHVFYDDTDTEEVRPGASGDAGGSPPAYSCSSARRARASMLAFAFTEK